MPTKRGRPVSSEVVDASSERQREAWRRQQQDHRRRQRPGQTDTSSTPRYVPGTGTTTQTTKHLGRGERILDLTVTEEESAAATLMQLGLRVQNLTLPQDPASAQLQQGAIDVNEHAFLYPARQAVEQIEQPSTKVSAKEFFSQFAIIARQNKSEREPLGLSRYFSSLPARNPAQLHGTTDLPTHATSSHAQQLHASPTQHSDSRLPVYDDDPNFDVGIVEDLDVHGNTGGEEEIAEGNEENISQIGFAQEIGDFGISSKTQPIVRGSEDQLGEEQLNGNYAFGIRTRGVDDSDVEFVSHHSTDGDDESITQEEPADEYVARKLYEQLQGGFHGCSDGEHEESRCEHMNSAGDNHHGLGAVFNDDQFPSVLGLQEMITPERLDREQTPTAAQWEAMFCGLPPEGRQHLPMNVCLHEEQTHAIEPEVAFDIDSFLGFADSLAVARQGLWYQPAPQMRQNMTSDVHLETRRYEAGDDPEQPERLRAAMLRDTPHFLLGRIEGAHDITLYVLFPHVIIVGDKFKSLTQEQLSRWTDRIYLPALHKFYKAHYTQHIPASHRNAYDNSKAHQVEGRQVQTSSYQAQQSIGYHLQPEHLDEIWRDVLETIGSTPGLADFRDSELFLSAKGTKLRFKTGVSRPTLIDAMQHFEQYLGGVLNLDFIQTDRFYVDLGKEICPSISLVAKQTQQIGEEAQVLLWKRCCLEKYIKWMYDGQPPPKSNRGQLYFTQNMLYDAGSLTSVAPKQSKHREGGLLYSQFYSSVKELYDATKCFPFANDAMEELALDPQIRKAARSTAGGNRRDAKIVEAGYIASKRRTSRALQDARRKSFGIREEHRVRWDLFQRLKSLLESQTSSGLELSISDCPSYTWPIKTEVYMDFLWRSADKFATGFEIVRAQSRADLVTWEQTKVMAMFLRCLRYVFGGHLLSRESPLWWSKRERTIGDGGDQRVRVWYGLGFRNTLPKCRYCWLEPRMDWSRLQFKSEVTDQMLFGNNVLRGQYLRRGGQVQDFFGRTRQLEVALGWLHQYYDSRVVRDQIVSWAVHLCLQQFRIDVLHAVAGEIRAERREEVLKGQEGFSYEYLEEVMVQGCYLMSGNKTDFKQVAQLGHFLFDWNDGLTREHWEERGFRVLYQRARRGLRQQGKEVEATFERRFWRWLYKYHWVLPYPCGNALLQTTKQGQRMWYSIKARTAVGGAGPWMWARKDWEIGRPAAVPEYVNWGKEAWEMWMSQRSGIIEA